MWLTAFLVFPQETPLHAELHPHAPVRVLHFESHCCLRQRCGAVWCRSRVRQLLHWLCKFIIARSVYLFSHGSVIVSVSKPCAIHTQQTKYSSSFVSNQRKYGISQLSTFTFFNTPGSRDVLTEVSWASRLLCLLPNIHGHNFTLAAEFTAVGDLCLNQLAKMLVPIVLDGVYSHCYCCSPSSQFNFTDFPFTTLQNHKMECEFWVVFYTDTIGCFFCASFPLLCWQADVYWFASVTLVACIFCFHSGFFVLHFWLVF